MRYLLGLASLVGLAMFALGSLLSIGTIMNSAQSQSILVVAQLHLAITLLGFGLVVLALGWAASAVCNRLEDILTVIKDPK